MTRRYPGPSVRPPTRGRGRATTRKARRAHGQPALSPVATGVPGQLRVAALILLWIGALVGLIVIVLQSGSAPSDTSHPVHLAATGRTAIVLAQGGDSDPGQSIDLGTFLTNLRKVLIGILGAITVCYLTIGGIRMVIAGGDPGEVEKAKSALRSGIYGFCATLLAPAIVSLLWSLFGGGGR
jgi:type IV secretion system pilin